MRLFLFKIFSRLAEWALPNKERTILLREYHSMQLKLHDKDMDLLSTIRPSGKIKARYYD